MFAQSANLTPEFNELLKQRSAAPTRERVTLETIEGFLKEAYRIVRLANILSMNKADTNSHRTLTLRACTKSSKMSDKHTFLPRNPVGGTPN